MTASRWGRGNQCEARGQVGNRHGYASGWEDHGAGFCFGCCVLRPGISDIYRNKGVQGGPSGLYGCCEFLQQPRAPTMQCTTLGPPGMALGALPALSSHLGTPDAKDHAQQVPPVCSRDPISSAFLSFHRTEAESAALRVLPQPWPGSLACRPASLSPAQRASEVPKTDAGGASLARSAVKCGGGGQGVISAET